jgi:glyoxylase-like metal-dependent hydrolase (beta-lactamase superfamily II)
MVFGIMIIRNRSQVELELIAIPVGPYGTNCYIIRKKGERSSLLIDPGCQPEVIDATLTARGMEPKFILVTHGHYDHVSAIPQIARKYKASYHMHPADEAGYRHQEGIIKEWGGEILFDFQRLEEKEYRLPGFEELPFTVIHTPGHSPGSVCFDFGGHLFSGDTIFYGTVGRTDIPGGEPRVLAQSLKKIVELFPQGAIYPGHGEATDIESEKKRNFFIKRYCP